MKEHNEKITDPKEIEKEIGDFLSKKFGGEVKIVSPHHLSRDVEYEGYNQKTGNDKKINFDLKPEDLIAYLDQYIIKQENAKAVLSTKICTHFNRIRREMEDSDEMERMVGRIKNNVLMIGPTGVGKTYMIKLIAYKLGVPFVKGDATKFSETGYVGGDIEDLVRDLVREADDDIELAQNGIIYIDEIDKIASSRNMIGADVSRTGVQRALLKPMEETEVDLKANHDPISMIQEIERFRKTGKREKRTVNTRNILFIMSGAFSDLGEIIGKRVRDRGIGFGATVSGMKDDVDILRHVKSEDLIEFGFESEFVGRLPVLSVFEYLTEEDLYEILINPNNPVILGKKLDFASYHIDIKFEDAIIRDIAKAAYQEKTGARGLVSAVEKVLLPFEKRLPSTGANFFPVTREVVDHAEETIGKLCENPDDDSTARAFEVLAKEEKKRIQSYVRDNREKLSEKYNLTLSESRIDTIAAYYCKKVKDIDKIIRKIKSFPEEIKKIELYFYKNHDINIVMEEDAIDYVIEQFVYHSVNLDTFYRQLTTHFEYGLKLIREKTGKNRFFITREALIDPEGYVASLINETNGKDASN